MDHPVGPLALAIDMALAPVEQGEKHGTKFTAFACQDIFLAWRSDRVGPGLEHAGGDKGLQPGGQDIAGDAKTLLPLLETTHP